MWTEMCRQNVFPVAFSMFMLWMLLSPFFMNIAITQSEEAVVGVNVDDWAEYGDILVTFDSTDPSAEPSEEVMKLEKTASYKNVVADVDYTQISFSHTATLKDGTQNTTMLQVEIASGLGNGSLMFVPAGLSEGELVYPYSPEEEIPIRINETVTRVYDSTARLVNHLNITIDRVVNNNPLQSIYTSISYYWDKETGVLTERSGIYINRTDLDVTSWTRSDKIKDTNLWKMNSEVSPDGNETDDFPYGLVGLMAVAVVLIVAGVLWPRKKRLKTRRSRMRRKPITRRKAMFLALR